MMVCAMSITLLLGLEEALSDEQQEEKWIKCSLLSWGFSVLFELLWCDWFAQWKVFPSMALVQKKKKQEKKRKE